MAKGDILLSPKHGVNPSVMLCWYCGDDMGVALLGKLKGDIEAPRQMVLDRNPCDRCKGAMEKGIMFIQVKDGESGPDPYRMGPMCAITEEAFERLGIQPKELHDDILKKRVCFLEERTWSLIGLPIVGKA